MYAYVRTHTWPGLLHPLFHGCAPAGALLLPLPSSEVVRSLSYRRIADPCRHIADPCRRITDPCRRITDPCRRITDPCRHIADPCRHSHMPRPHPPPMLTPTRPLQWAPTAPARPKSTHAHTHKHTRTNMNTHRRTSLSPHGRGGALTRMQLHACGVLAGRAAVVGWGCTQSGRCLRGG